MFVLGFIIGLLLGGGLGLFVTALCVAASWGKEDE